MKLLVVKETELTQKSTYEKANDSLSPHPSCGGGLLKADPARDRYTVASGSRSLVRTGGMQGLYEFKDAFGWREQPLLPQQRTERKPLCPLNRCCPKSLVTRGL